MKAAIRLEYGSPDVLEIADLPLPTPGPGHALVRVHAASLNTADLDHLRGRPLAARLGTGLRRPKTGRVGLDVAGTVEEVGPEVRGLRPGDEVWADLFSAGHGAFAEYVSAPETVFAPKPSGITFEEASAVPHSGVLALQGLLGKGPIQKGDRVLVNGAGGCVGPFAVQIAKAFGAEVTGVDRTAKLEMIGRLGAHHVVDYTRQDITKSEWRYDLILDIAATRPFLSFRRLLTPGGRYVLIARTLGGFFQAAVIGGLVSIRGNRRMGVFPWVPSRRQDLDTLGELIEAGKLTPVIDRRFPLEEIVQAARYLEEGRARGKMVLVPPTTD